MQKAILIVIIAIYSTANVYSSNQCDISGYYEDFISIRKLNYDGREYLSKTIHQTLRKSCISELVNNSIKFIDYLLVNYSSNSNYNELLKLNDSTSLQKNYINCLKNDSLFNSVMTELVSKTIDKTLPKDSITIDEILNIAVKFFSITSITESGAYVGHICVGMNSIDEIETNRQPFIEAFSYSSIFEHLKTKDFDMLEDFKIAMSDLYKVNLGKDQKENLLRAQGAIFLMMRNNEKLNKLLNYEYEQKKDNLPFVLVND